MSQGVRRIGYACAWSRPPEATWSYIPWNLRAALQRRVPLVDLPAENSRALAAAFYYGHRWTHRRHDDGWQALRAHEVLTARRVRRAAARTAPDAVLQIGDLARLDRPYFVYQDMNRLLLREWFDRIGPQHLGYAEAALEVLPRRVAVQNARLGAAAGVFAMSAWQAAPLVAAGVVPPGRSHVVYAGISARSTADARPQTDAGRRLLFVGGDFRRKGGDIAVDALALVRDQLGADVTLTVIGPVEWPLPGDPPPGVDFRGRQTPDQAGAALLEHDVFLMPTRFEAFGVAFAEALAAGLPCVGPDAFAVPEIVGSSGVLVAEWTAEAYAAAVVRALADDGLRERVRLEADAVADRFSWDAVAGRMLAAMEAELDA